MIDAAKIGGIGASEASPLFAKDFQKSQGYKTLLINKVYEMLSGEKPSFTNSALEHGINTEQEAFDYLHENIYPNSTLQSSESFFKEDGMWATPDVIIGDNNALIDIKCPISQRTYFSNIARISKNYLVQAHWQMYCTGIREHSFFYYLAPSVSGLSEVKWAEKRVQVDEFMLNDIPLKFQAFKEDRNDLFDRLFTIDFINNEEFYELNLSHKVTPLKNKGSIASWNSTNVVSYDDELYFKELVV